MATKYLFSNNATTTLAQSISATATVINVASGDGSLFPSPGTGEAFPITLVDSATELKNEICYCTARSGDQLTVTRGQENTNAVAWSAGDIAANYITAGTIESWLQESDLDDYATELWVNDTFVGKAEGDQDYSPSQAGVNKSSGEIWLSYANSSGDVEYAFAQPAGDYALQTALTAEVTRAEAAEETLNNDKVNRSGDTMTGPLTSSGWIFGGVNGGMSGTPTAGTYMWTEGIGFGNPYNSGNFRGTWCVSDVFDEGSANTAGVNLTGYDATSKVYQWYFAWNGNITTPKGLVAFQSELPTSGTITGGTYTKVPMNDGTGRSVVTQSFTGSMNTHGGVTIKFPISYSEAPVVIAGSNGANDSSTDTDYYVSDVTNESFYFNTRNTLGDFQFSAQGIVTS